MTIGYIDKPHWRTKDHVLDLKLLTSGNLTLSNEQNKIIFYHVFEHIKRSEKSLSLSLSISFFILYSCSINTY
jgi:hypothetical protein